MHRGRNKTTKTTLRSERISALKKDLTGSAPLEMYGNRSVNQALTTFQIPYASQFLVPYQHGFVSRVLSLTCPLNAPCRAFRVDLFGKHQDKKRTRPEAIS
jgi:hypothetical protein